MQYAEFEQRFLAARQGVIARDFPELNAAQLRAAMKTSGPVRIVAGAGSGKTATLIDRAANLIKYGRASDCRDIPDDIDDDDAITALEAMERYAETGDPAVRLPAEKAAAYCVPPPYKILAITFTNKAAKELKDRLAAKLGETGQMVQAMTFHSLGMRLLRRFGSAVGIDPQFLVCDENTKIDLIKSIKKSLDLDPDFMPVEIKDKDMATAFSRLKHASRNTDIRAPRTTDVPVLPPPEDPYDPQEAYIRAAFALYSNHLALNGLLDFDDLILRTYDMLADPGILTMCRDMYWYVMVDEYQDTDTVQDALMRLLTDDSHNLCVVGDDDQSIYKFRGADVDIFRQFGGLHREAATVVLERNYRSTSTIVEAADAMIEHNKDRIGKVMTAERPEGMPVTIYNARDPEDEAAFIARRIRENVANGMKYSDHAILARTNGYLKAKAMQSTLANAMIPYELLQGTGFYDSQEIRDLIAYFYTAQNPTNDVYMTRLVMSFCPGVREKAWQRIKDAAANKGVSPIDVMLDGNALNGLGFKKAAGPIMEFAAGIAEMNKLAHDEDAAGAVEKIIELSGYLDRLRGQLADLEAEEGEYIDDGNDHPADEKRSTLLNRIDNVETMIAMGKYYHSENAGTDEDKLIHFLSRISTDMSQDRGQTDRVHLLTAHRSKGLEFKCVFVVNMNEGAFPSTFGTNPDIQEERRLFYVAMTRAMDQLYLTRSAKDPVRTWLPSLLPSRFLQEIPDEYKETASY